MICCTSYVISYRDITWCAFLSFVCECVRARVYVCVFMCVCKTAVPFSMWQLFVVEDAVVVYRVQIAWRFVFYLLCVYIYVCVLAYSNQEIAGATRTISPPLKPYTLFSAIGYPGSTRFSRNDVSKSLSSPSWPSWSRRLHLLPGGAIIFGVCVYPLSQGTAVLTSSCATPVERLPTTYPRGVE